MDNKPYMQYEPGESSGLIARWYGGAYIELGHVDDVGVWRALDIAANTWDYAAGKPREEFRTDPFGAMQRAVDAKLAEED